MSPSQMPPAGETTLTDMLNVAHDEAVRIEICESSRLRAGERKEPLADQVRKRNAFRGMVRLIEKVSSSQQILLLLKEIKDVPPAAAEQDEMEDEPAQRD